MRGKVSLTLQELVFWCIPSAYVHKLEQFLCYRSCLPCTQYISTCQTSVWNKKPIMYLHNHDDCKGQEKEKSRDKQRNKDTNSIQGNSWVMGIQQAKRGHIKFSNTRKKKSIWCITSMCVEMLTRNSTVIMLKLLVTVIHS